MATPSFDPVIRTHLDKMADGLADEFEGIYDREHCRALVDESATQLARGAVDSFVPVLAHRFARERLIAQARAEGRLGQDVYDVVFVSLGGGGRAQIGAALLSRAAGANVNVHTAGSQAEGGVDLNVKEALAELDIDVSEEFTRPLSREVLAGADLVVTMGRSVGAVDIPESTRHVDWRVGDPLGAELDEVRRVVDDIRRRVDSLAAELAS
jgi:protein-tyrosine-phosphatase